MLLVVAAPIVGCGSTAVGTTAVGTTTGKTQIESTRVLSSGEAKEALLRLPYRFTFRHVDPPKWASGAIAGRAVGLHHTVLDFGVSLGRRPYPVSVPRAGTSEVSAYLNGAFAYTDDLQVPGRHERWEPGPQFHTEAQWHEAGHMGVEMREKLCIAATGRVCQIG